MSSVLLCLCAILPTKGYKVSAFCLQHKVSDGPAAGGKAPGAVGSQTPLVQGPPSGRQE